VPLTFGAAPVPQGAAAAADEEGAAALLLALVCAPPLAPVAPTVGLTADFELLELEQAAAISSTATASSAWSTARAPRRLLKDRASDMASSPPD
jgi:hypothetical protein